MTTDHEGEWCQVSMALSFIVPQLMAIVLYCKNQSIHRPSSIIHHRRCSLFSKRDYLEIDEESKIVMTSWIEDLRFLFGQNRKRRKGDEKRIQNDFQAKPKRNAMQRNASQHNRHDKLITHHRSFKFVVSTVL
jgi:hypothetical protein